MNTTPRLCTITGWDKDRERKREGGRERERRTVWEPIDTVVLETIAFPISVSTLTFSLSISLSPSLIPSLSHLSLQRQRTLVLPHRPPPTAAASVSSDDTSPLYAHHLARAYFRPFLSFPSHPHHPQHRHHRRLQRLQSSQREHESHPPPPPGAGGCRWRCSSTR